MNTRFGVVWLLLVASLQISRLAAQDVTVTDPAWFESDNPPAEQPPQFKKHPKPFYPADMKKADCVGYAIVPIWVATDGNRAWHAISATNPYFEKAVVMAGDDVKFSPIVRAGHSGDILCWYAVIFNPHAARKKGPDATPRLLQVAPVIVPSDLFPKEVKMPIVAWATVSVDASGMPTGFVFEDAAYEVIRQRVERVLPKWRFAPARQNGQAVAAKLLVPVLVMQPIQAPSEGEATLPRLLNKLSAVYPHEMSETGLNGDVAVEFEVNTAGKVTNPVVVRSSNPGFDNNAIKAVLALKFRPAMCGGKPVTAKLQVQIFFSMEEGGRDLMEVETKKDTMKKLPEGLRYDTPPKIEGVMTPVYPYQLLREEKEGKATVAMLIDENGKVREVRVKEATDPAFGHALVAAVRTFRFTPAMKDGRPILAVMGREQTFDPSGFENFPSPDDLDLLRLEAKKPEKIVSAKALDAPLKAVSRLAPVYPLDTTFDEGKAIVELLIDKEGFVRLPRTVEASEPAFGYSAVQAASVWRFEPPKAGGKPVVVRVRVPFVFKREIPAEAPAAKDAATDTKPATAGTEGN